MKQYKVKVYYGSIKTEFNLSANNSAHAITIAKKVYPTSRVISAQQTK